MLETLGILFNSSDRSDQMKAVKRVSRQVVFARMFVVKLLVFLS